MTIHTLQDLCYAYNVADPVREMMFALQDRIDALEAQRKPLTEAQQAEPVAWDKPSASFNAWWDSYRHDPANPFAEGSAAYWAWAGWQAAQRQWVGLTDEDVNRESAPIAQQMKLAFHAGMYVAQQILKERNNG